MAVNRIPNPADVSMPAVELSGNHWRDEGRAMGSIFVEEGRLSPEQVEEIRAYAGVHKLRFGEAAVRLKLVTPEDVEYVLARGGEHGVGDELIAAYDPHNPMVERLRAIRSQLLLGQRADAAGRILAIASPERREGRSWFAANLATVFAQLGQRTLVIDADLRNPRQHAVFNVANEGGLSALLTGRASRDVLRRIHPQLRLHVLTAGPLPPNPQELLGRPVFESVLARFAERFDMIIVDTPAVTETADAQMIASRAGSALLLARRHRTRHRRLSAALQSLTRTGVNVVGSVVNEY
jgi:chain length determinant protein tyrosine kinase EpsG